MYRQVGEELVDTGLADHMDGAVWIDTQCYILEESDTYGCKVNLNITDLDWVLVMDEVGGNTNKRGMTG